jgi:hypothetical protein
VVGLDFGVGDDVIAGKQFLPFLLGGSVGTAQVNQAGLGSHCGRCHREPEA